MGITKKQAEIAIIVIGLAAIAVVVPINISRARKQLKAGSSEPAESEPRKAPPAAAGGTSAPASTLENRARQEASLKKPIGRDPFAMPSRMTKAAIVKTSPLVLKGISVRKGADPVALIGSAIVRKGGMVGDAEVVEIGKDYVLVRRDGKEYKLTLERGR